MFVAVGLEHYGRDLTLSPVARLLEQAIHLTRQTILLRISALLLLSSPSS